MTTRELTWDEIEAQFGPFEEIETRPDGRWSPSALHVALAKRLLWTRVDPGLVSTGMHYVNREAYLRSARPYAADEEIVEVDPELHECKECGDWVFEEPLCSACGAER